MSKRLRREGETSREAGFTLIEVVIAISLIGAAMLTVLAAATSGFGYQDMARQRQTAVGVGNRVIEELRARPFAELRTGITPINASAPPPHAIRCRKVWKLVGCDPVAGFAGAGEPLLNVGTSTVAPLSPNTETITINGIPYTWTAFVSQSAPGKPLRLVAFVDWTWRGRAFSTSLQSLLWVPDGCIAGPSYPIAGVCPGGQSNVGVAVPLKISVNVTDTTATKACANVDADSTCTTSPAAAKTWDVGRVGVSFEEGGGIQTVTGSVWVDEASSVLAQTAQADTDTTNGTPPSVGPFGIDSSATSLWDSGSINFKNTNPSLDSNWKITLRYPTDPDIVGSAYATATGACGGSSAPCAGGVLANNLDGIRLSVTCTSGSIPGSCPGTSEIPLVDVSGKYDVPDSVTDVYWDVIAKTETVSGVTSMVLQRRIGEIRMGCVGLAGPGTCSWLGILYNLADGFTQSLAAGATAVTPGSTTFKLNTLSNSATCVQASTLAGVEESNAATRWTAAAGTRCMATSAAGPGTSWKNLYVFRFSGMAYTAPAVAARRVTGPSLVFSFQIEYCTNNSCSASEAHSPVFKVTLSIPAMSVTPLGVEW